MSPTNELPEFSFRRLFPLVFVIIFLLHAPLLRLPFFWDEAGFYVPAAYDLAHSHTLIAKTTLDTGHPPLSAAYLALWFTLSGWKPAVARVAMLLLAAFALTKRFHARATACGHRRCCGYNHRHRRISDLFLCRAL